MISGTYTFRLSVTNNYGNTATDDINVVVSNGTPPPPPPPGGGSTVFANAGADQTITLPTNSVFLMGGGSYAQSGWITSYQWSQVSGPITVNLATINTTNVQALNLVAGTYVFRLRVTSNTGATSTDDMSVTVNAATGGGGGTVTGAPVAVAGNEQWVTLPNKVFLTGSGSYDAGGWITGYAWSQVSGPTTSSLISISNSNVEATNLVAGVYTFRLTVTDNSGLTNSATVKVNVYGSASGFSSASSTSAIEQAGANSNAALSVYPNPAISTTTVEFSNSYTGNFQINFVDATGKYAKRVSATKTASAFKQQIDISSLAVGTYAVEILFPDGNKLTSTILKQ